MKKYFEGWYYKHQNNGKSLSLIPGKSSDEAFVLIVTDESSYHIRYPLCQYRKSTTSQGAFRLKVGRNIFSPSGVTLNICRPELSLVGKISYTDITPICSDIMGPFKYFPMECRHGIISMNHSLHGTVELNGQLQYYSGGKGYIESDSGRSFPSKYTWVHCNDFKQDCSIMASVAQIPFYGLRFWGCICVVWLNGREYRLATYKGVKILRCEPGHLVLKQGEYQLAITVEPKTAQKLPAPHHGKMSRFIRESLSCLAHFKFMKGGCCLFDEKSDHASYEYSRG